MKYILLLALVLTGCSVEPERTIKSSNQKLDVHVIGTVDGCTIYRFDDGETVHFVRCIGSPIAEAEWSDMHGKVSVRHQVETITQ